MCGWLDESIPALGGMTPRAAAMAEGQITIPRPEMKFDIGPVLRVKEEARKRLAAKPIEEKFRILDELRAASVALRAACAELRSAANAEAKAEQA